jgi:hypothetical protein
LVIERLTLSSTTTMTFAGNRAAQKHAQGPRSPIEVGQFLADTLGV